MDVDSECSVLESVADNELNTTTTNPDHIANVDGDDKVKANGSFLNEIHVTGSGGSVDTNALPHDEQVKEGVEIEELGNSVSSSPLAVKSPDRGSPPVRKGYGLRKWRRIKRDVVKDGNVNSDGGKALKRGLSVSANTSKPVNLMPVEMKQNSEGSVGSSSALRNVGVAEGFLTHESSLESRLAFGSAFTAGTDSENSEDRSSKSSTAASAPRLRHDLPAMLGHVREKNKMKNLSGNGVGSSAQLVQQGKGQVGSIKKARGERVKIEKENSHSSIESDSRSSNFVFVQGVYSMTSNGKQSESSMNYDGENSDEAHAGEQEYGEEVQTGYGKENVGEDDLSRDELAAEASWVDKEEKSENNLSSTDQDPLVESILKLHSVQEALENEVKKFGEIGDLRSVPVDSTLSDPAIHESKSSDEFDSENIRQSSSLESQLLTLTENVKDLENKLEEAKAILKLKESMITKLEATLNNGTSPKEESENTRELQQENSSEMVTELEDFFREKVEAEILYLALTRTVKKLRAASGDQVTLFEEQEALVIEQEQMRNKLGEAESKATILKKEAEHLEQFCADILGTKEMMKVQKRVCKTTSYFLIQLMLFFLAFYLLVLQLSPHSSAVVPT